MRPGALALALAVALAAPVTAHADDEVAKNEARALLQGGNKLREAGDLAGALGLYESAYATFPSAKILLNIGTTLRDLGRTAEAANVYARYLAAPDTAPERTKEVTKILADLAKGLGQLTITVEPADAELAIGNSAYLAASTLARWRVVPGSVTVRAKKDGFEPGETTVTVKKAKSAAVTLTLQAVVVAAPVTTLATSVAPDAVPTGPDTGVRTSVTVATPSRLGITARALVDGRGRGAAGSAGVLVRVDDRVALHVAAIFANPGELVLGGYVAAHVELGRGPWRPRVVVGLPVIFDDGTHVSGRGAAGVAWFASPRFAIALELGAEYMFNPADDIDAWQLTPTLGAEAHL